MEARNLVEPGDIEKLIMRTQVGDWLYMAICPDDGDSISFAVKSNQVILNKEEALLIIEGLQDCLNDMEKENNHAVRNPRKKTSIG